MTSRTSYVDRLLHDDFDAFNVMSVPQWFVRSRVRVPKMHAYTIAHGVAAHETAWSLEVAIVLQKPVAYHYAYRKIRVMYMYSALNLKWSIALIDNGFSEVAIYT